MKIMLFLWLLLLLTLDMVAYSASTSSSFAADVKELTTTADEHNRLQGLYSSSTATAMQKSQKSINGGANDIKRPHRPRNGANSLSKKPCSLLLIFGLFFVPYLCF